MPPHRRKPLRGALFIENSSVSVHYLRDPPGRGQPRRMVPAASAQGPLATSDGRQWGFTCQTAVGLVVGAFVGRVVGILVGAFVGALVGVIVGRFVGALVVAVAM